MYRNQAQAQAIKKSQSVLEWQARKTTTERHYKRTPFPQNTQSQVHYTQVQTQSYYTPGHPQVQTLTQTQSVQNWQAKKQAEYLHNKRVPPHAQKGPSVAINQRGAAITPRPQEESISVRVSIKPGPRGKKSRTKRKKSN